MAAAFPLAKPCVRIEDHDCVARGIEQRPEFHLAVEQCLLRTSLIRDIPEDRLDPDRLARRITHGGLHHLHMSSLAVPLVLFDGFEQFAGLHDVQVIVPVFLGQLCRVEIVVGLADQIAQRSAHEFREGTIPKSEPSIQIFAQDVDGQVFHE